MGAVVGNRLFPFLFMKIKQVELKTVNIKAQVSQDKSVRLIFDVNLNERNDININEIHKFLYKPLTLEIQEDEYDR